MWEEKSIQLFRMILSADHIAPRPCISLVTIFFQCEVESTTLVHMMCAYVCVCVCSAECVRMCVSSYVCSVCDGNHIGILWLASF